MWAPKQVLNLLSCVSMCHLLNANKEKKYKGVLEIKYHVGRFDRNFKDHLLGFLMFCTHTNIAYFILVLQCNTNLIKSCMNALCVIFYKEQVHATCYLFFSC